MKKTIFIVTLIIILLSASVFVFSQDSKSEEDILYEKVDSEIKYLDNSLQNLLNKTNGLSFETYKINVSKIESGEENGTSKTSEEGQSSSKSNGEAGGSSGGDSKESSEKNGESGENEEDSSSKNAKKYTMSFNSTLTEELTTDWNYVKQEIEIMYTSWNTMILDLYKVNVEKQDILDFSLNLDMAIQKIQNEDKPNALVSLAVLYSYIPKFYNSYGKDEEKLNIYKTKAEVLAAYAIVENKSNEDIIALLQKALEIFKEVINNTDSNGSEISINKTYILLNEIQNVVPARNLPLFYLKYKNLMQELNNIIS